ncbi:MAG: phosphonate ABC transporter, permease protein PhnE [Rubrobacter sp.]
MGAKTPTLAKGGESSVARALRFVVLLLAGAFFVWSVVAVNFNPVAFAQGIPDLVDLVSRMFPPDVAYAPTAALAALETLQMALVGTVASAILSVPLAFLAAANVAPNRVLYYVSRSFIVFTRAIPDLIWALIFVSAVGLGPFPGTLAIAVHSIGMLGKLYAESIEEIDHGQVEALRSTGAHPLQTLALSVVPQVLPSFVGLTLYRWDINIRNSIVLGLVGAGGLGFELQTSMRLFQYPQVLTILILVFVIVLIVEQSSSYVRERVI